MLIWNDSWKFINQIQGISVRASYGWLEGEIERARESLVFSNDERFRMEIHRFISHKPTSTQV